MSLKWMWPSRSAYCPIALAGSIRAEREVTRVDAQVEIGVVDESLDLVGELDVATGVGMDDGKQPVATRDHGDLGHLVEHRPPPVGIEPLGGVGAAGGADADVVGSIDDREHGAARGGDGAARPFGGGHHPIALRRVVQVVEDERADRGQVAAAQHGPQGLWILREIPDRAELEGADPRRLDVVEHLFPRRVARGVGEVDTPGDGAGGELDRTRCHTGSLRGWSSARGLRRSVATPPLATSTTDRVTRRVISSIDTVLSPPL